jgi:hypothetical protein
MKSRVRKQVEIAGMVVMHVGDDDVPDRTGTDTEPRQRLHRIERELAVSQARFLGVETGINQNIAATAPDQPDEVIKVRRRGLVRVRRQVIHMGGTRRHRRVAQRVDFVSVFHRLNFFFSD